MADIILLLVSASFIASDYCYDIEMNRSIERHNSGECLVIPILLRPVVWQIAPFAKLSPLPRNGKPVTTWTNWDEAFADIAEGIRHAVVKVKSNTTLQLKSLRCLKIKDGINELNSEKIDNIINRLRDMSRDVSIKLTTIVAESGTLILEGSREGLEAIEQLFQNNKLTDELGVLIESFTYLDVKGAGIRHSTRVLSTEEAQIVEETYRPGLMVFPSPKFSPLFLKGIKVYHEDPWKVDFLFDGGDSGLKPESAEYEREVKKLVDYFLAARAILEKDFWVNLSAYEDNKMIPQALGETELGRDLLAQDCLLKQFTASLLHPDGELGKRYWDAVYTKAYELYGTTNIPINTFQKVWVVPEKAVIYEKSAGEEYPHELTNYFAASKDDEVAIVGESSLNVMCEVDCLALKNNLNNHLEPQAMQDVNDFCISIFKETILPAIKREVNMCENFKLIRQMYHSIVLAVWYKRKFKDNPKLKKFIDTDKFEGFVLKVSEKNLGVTKLKGTNLNEIFHKQYLDLFQGGVYHCIRKQFDTNTQQVITRTYFSGAIELGIIRITNTSTCSCGKFRPWVQVYGIVSSHANPGFHKT